MTYSQTQTSHYSKIRMGVRLIGLCVGLFVCVYIYFVFSTTSLIAQHRSYEKQLNEMVAQRSDLEYEYHNTAEQLFATSAASYDLNSPSHLTYISLSEGVNVAFARDTQ